MSENLYIFTVLAIAGTFIIVFGLRFLASSHDARARAAKEDAYRELAAKSATVQSDIVSGLARIQAEISTLGVRLMTIEKTLSEVG